MGRHGYGAHTCGRRGSYIFLIASSGDGESQCNLIVLSPLLHLFPHRCQLRSSLFHIFLIMSFHIDSISEFVARCSVMSFRKTHLNLVWFRLPDNVYILSWIIPHNGTSS